MDTHALVALGSLGVLDAAAALCGADESQLERLGAVVHQLEGSRRFARGLTDSARAELVATVGVLVDPDGAPTNWRRSTGSMKGKFCSSRRPSSPDVWFGQATVAL